MTRRSLTSTLPADLPPSSRAWLSDRPGWCVDLGATLVAMRTCDLWLALAKDEITPQTKVWREGMPYWTEIEKVPEFALAMPDATVWAPGEGPKRSGALDKAPSGPRATTVSGLENKGSARPSRTTSGLRSPADAARATSSGLGQAPASTTTASAARDKAPVPAWAFGGTGGVAASDPSAAGVMSLVPPSDHATPPPFVVEHRASEPAPRGSRRIFPRMDRRGAVSVALGAIIAFAALTFATTGPVASHGSSSAAGAPSPRAASAGARDHGPAIDFAALVRVPEPSAEREVAPSPALDPAAPSGVAITAATVTATSHERARPSRGPHAADRGQRRAR